MQTAKRIHNYFWITLFLFLVYGHAGASVIQLTPPASLTIDGQSISEGVFTLESFITVDSGLTETEILSRANPADDIVHAAVIGSGETIELLNFSGPSLISKFTYNFDSSAPDLPAIVSNVISASDLFIISLPFSSAVSDFFEVIDFSGNATFHSTAAVLDTAASGATNIDLLGNGSVFATFGVQNTQLVSQNFQAHGNITVPVPGSLWLVLFGVLLLIRKLPI